MGTVLAINITIAKDLKILLVNIYGPNKDDPDFYQELENIIINNASDYTIICGVLI